MLQFVKQVLRIILPRSVWDWVKPITQYIKSRTYNLKIKQVQSNQNKALSRIKNKEKVKVVFLLIHDADWKYDGVYRLMEKDERFDPIVLVCPFITYGKDFMVRVMNQSYDSFKKEGYQVIKALNEDSEKWLNVRLELHPDIVCFTSPWNLTKPEYLLNNYLDILTCYVPYGYETSHLHDAYYNNDMQNLVWKFFIENEIHKQLSLKYSRNKAKNVIVSGYPGMDRFLISNNMPQNHWKIKDKNIKRIIWAAHHTIPGMGASLNYSTFMDYYEVMFQLAIQYKEQIQIAFKPHPILRENLSKDDVWGKEKTDLYYQKWSELNNGLLAEGDYMDLFFTSDAMIHDCGSFLIEYLYTNKPVLYLWNDDSIPERFNEVGKIALTKLYRANKKDDIEKFIKNVVINEDDSLLKERIQFFDNVIAPPNKVSASENIFNHIKSSIFD